MQMCVHCSCSGAARICWHLLIGAGSIRTVPFTTGTVELPFAPDDEPHVPGPVSTFSTRAQALAKHWFDFKFLGEAKQCGNPEMCSDFEKDFLWDDWMDPVKQAEYKYVIDVDGNGWSGRFHRCVLALLDFPRRHRAHAPLFVRVQTHAVELDGAQVDHLSGMVSGHDPALGSVSRVPPARLRDSSESHSRR